MKLFLAILLTSVVILTGRKSHAEFGISYQETLKNRYTAPGDLVSLVDSPVLQHNFFFNLDGGFSGDFWACSKLDPWLEFVELDGGGSYTRSWDNMKLDVCLSFFNNRNLEVFGVGDVLYTKVQLVESITECDVIEKIETYHLIGFGLNGELFSLALKKKDRLKGFGSVSSTWGLTLDDGAFGLPSALLFKVNLDFNWEVEKDISLSSGVDIGVSITDRDMNSSGRNYVPIIYLTSSFN